MCFVAKASDDKNIPQNMSQLFAHFMNETGLNVITIHRSMANPEG
jgi:hypothetical protein